MKTDQVNIYEMKLNELKRIRHGCSEFTIMRVPGGWLYNFIFNGYETCTSVFVPFNNEFQTRNNQ